jgi:DNA-directed RNA polymerase specialized sigma24 family protein
MALVEKYGASLLRVARLYFLTQSAAEEVVADTWLAVVTGLERLRAARR